ncbi:hypothetical protein Taro_051927, partial [Colocasia esculenta]|nr:hypothetical protein [Colocasia esculenta]
MITVSCAARHGEGAATHLREVPHQGRQHLGRIQNRAHILIQKEDKKVYSTLQHSSCARFFSSTTVLWILPSPPSPSSSSPAASALPCKVETGPSPSMSTAEITRVESSKVAEAGGGHNGKHRRGMGYRYSPTHSAARSLCLGLVILLLLAGITALVLYLVYRPSKPRFAVVSAAVYALSSTPAPTTVTASMQFTVVIRNPNDRSSVAYDRLAAYVTNRGEAITPPAPLPPLVQGRDSTVAVSPALGGAPVPVSSAVAGGLAADQAYGAAALRLVVMGRLRYKAGPFRSAWTHVFVRCDLLVGVRRGVQGQVPILGAPDCDQMSLLDITESPKHCAQKGLNAGKLSKKLLYALSSASLTVLSIVFVVWLILRPSKPGFYLRDAGVYQLSLSPPRLLNSTVQFTLVSTNPNARVGVYYDQLRAYAAYRGQQITGEIGFPPFYQGHGDTNLLSASLSGAGVPVAASFGYEVGRDQTAGGIPIRLRLGGRVRWKVGTWVSGQYHIEVDCVAIVGFVPGDMSGPLTTIQGSQCSTTI